MIWVDALLLACAAVLAVPTLVLFAQATLALLPRRASGGPAAGRRPRVAVLVPAHDEAPVIEATLRELMPRLGTGDRLVVVADNCTDDTAQLAARAGAEVVERFDVERRGKGYALDRGVQSLRDDPPEVLVVVDADCEVQDDAVDRIARLALETDRPVQALYLMRSPADGGFGKRIAEFAWVVKNLVRPLGSHRLGVPCQLMGTGMAFPWSRVAAASMATGHITEDVLFGINLARAGAPPLFCPEARVASEFPASESGAQSQRRRWEHGTLGLSLGEGPRLLLHGLARRDLRIAGMALDLMVPPLALLALLLGGLFAASLAWAIASGGAKPLAAALALMALLTAAVLVSWVRYGRDIVTLGQLALAPLYALRKLSVYAGFVTRRQADWVRTRRDG